MTQHFRSLASGLVAAALAVFSSGCIINGNNGQVGNVTVTWTFNGQSCANTPGVTQVAISIPGQTLANSGVYACNTAGVDGITLTGFNPGTYSYSIAGEDSAGNVYYSASGSFSVNGDVAVQATMLPTANAPATTYIAWTFPANGAYSTPNCAQAGAVTVVATLDGVTSSALSFQCADGYGTRSGSFAGVGLNHAGGSHSLQLAAYDSDNVAYYVYNTTITSVGGSADFVQAPFGWGVGGLALGWAFSQSGVQKTCTGAGVTQVCLNLRDSSGNLVYGNTTCGQLFNCADTNGFQAATIDYLYPDTYQVILQASGTAANFSTDQNNPPVVTVVAGTFPSVGANTPAFTLSSP